MKYGVYVHVPFCRRKCDYCTFYSIPIDVNGEEGRSGLRSYVQRILVEASARFPSLGRPQVDTIYFGGGTPSILAPAQINIILEALDKHALIDRDAEITIEINPEDAAYSRLAAYRDAGITRAVLGVQTLNGLLHASIGRASILCGEETLSEFFSTTGLEHCIDIITGMPDQHEDDLIRDLESLTSYRPAHISAYILSIEKNTPLSKRMNYTFTTEEHQRTIFETTISYLGHKGYNHYEISNYALPGRESRHNMKYWKFTPYIGLGPGAHSFYEDRRLINAMSIEEYIYSSETRLEEDRRSAAGAMAEFFLTGLRLLKGISLRSMEERLNLRVPAPVLQKILELGKRSLLCIDERDGDFIISLKGEGIFLADSVIYEIVEYLL